MKYSWLLQRLQVRVPRKFPKVRGAWNNLWDVEGFLFRRFSSSYAVNSATFCCRVTSSLKCTSLCGVDTNVLSTFLRNSSWSFNDFFIIRSSLSAFLISLLLVNENKFKLESTRPENAFWTVEKRIVLKNLFAWRKIGAAQFTLVYINSYNAWTYLF